MTPISRRTFLLLSALMASPFRLPGLTREAWAATPQEKDRKHQLLIHQRPSETSGLADAIVIKDADLFFVTGSDGAVPLEDGHGYGLYWRDCRYLNGYEIRLGHLPLSILAATATRGFMAKFELANLKFKASNGNVIQREEIEVQWHRVIDSEAHSLHELLVVQNFGRQTAEVPLTLTFKAGFEDLYAVRGYLQGSFGAPRDPTWEHDALHFLYEGKDRLYRTLSIHFVPAPQLVHETTATFLLQLVPHRSMQIRLSLVVHETAEMQPAPVRTYVLPNIRQLEAKLQDANEQWMRSLTDVFSDSLILEEVVDRSFRDLRMLRMRMDEHTFFAAGTPWFTALFGRDSLLTALQTLAYDYRISEDTLRLLAKYQGQRVEEWRDEQPGKILHELRVGEAAHLGLIPHTPYYGSVDATPLFLILIAEYTAWQGTLDLFAELRPSIEAALEWLTGFGMREGSGYLAYSSTAEKGLENQGWKDSGDAIVNTDGRLAAPPIALVEAQAYAYWAMEGIAGLYQRAGEHERARKLRTDAADLRTRFNRDFWLAAKDCYALALQKDGSPVEVVTSNVGHALWTGIADSKKAEIIVARLMKDDMFSGWGIRTLSESEQAYNPVGYHLGSIWPHDTALIMAGFRRYGFDQDAVRLFEGLVKAAAHFKGYQLPELFAGFSQKEYDVPVPYPTANHPQAWAAGSVPYMVQMLLGLRPEALDRRLRIVRPVFPEFVDELELHRLRVGQAEVDLRFERRPDNTVAVRTLHSTGGLDIVIEA